jgi:hypothetical protein
MTVNFAISAEELQFKLDLDPVIGEAPMGWRRPSAL